jgi:hypothetical protein
MYVAESGYSTVDNYQTDFENIDVMSPQDVLEYVANMLGDVDGRLLDYKGEAERKIRMSNDERAWQDLVESMGDGEHGYKLGEFGSEGYAERRDHLIEVLTPLKDSESPEVAYAANGILAGIKKYEEDYKAWKNGELDKEPTPMRWSQDVLDDALRTSNTRVESYSSDNELIMMELGSLMQRRTQIVQFSSNVMAQLDRAMNTIVQNTGA